MPTGTLSLAKLSGRLAQGTEQLEHFIPGPNLARPLRQPGRKGFPLSRGEILGLQAVVPATGFGEQVVVSIGDIRVDHRGIRSCKGPVHKCGPCVSLSSRALMKARQSISARRNWYSTLRGETCNRSPISR
ncbi:hypothetical protein D3C72_1627220 [compost metagenome]